jgi:hypothetical protein
VQPLHHGVDIAVPDQDADRRAVADGVAPGSRMALQWRRQRRGRS